MKSPDFRPRVGVSPLARAAGEGQGVRKAKRGTPATPFVYSQESPRDAPVCRFSLDQATCQRLNSAGSNARIWSAVMFVSRKIDFTVADIRQ
jgi:hypothetical protein